MLATSDERLPAFRFGVILGRDQTEEDPVAAAAIDASAWFHLQHHVAKLQMSFGIVMASE